MHSSTLLPRPLRLTKAWALCLSLSLPLLACDDGGGEASADPDAAAGGSGGGVDGSAGGGGEPVGGEPMGGMPMGGEPVGGEPMGGMPMGGEGGMGGEPVGGMPMGGEPMGGMPMGGEPVGGEPVGGEPVGGMPMGGEPMGGEPMGGEPLEYVTGPLAEPPFPRGQLTTISHEGEAYVAWVQDEILWAWHLPAEGEPGEAVAIAEGVIAPARLQGAWSAGRWWVVAPMAPDSALVAYDLAADPDDVGGEIEMGMIADLQGPEPRYALGVDGDSVLVIGRGIPRDINERIDGAPLSLRTIVDGVRGPLRADGAGLLFPDSVLPGLDGWLMSSRGHCASWTPDGVYAGRWRCPLGAPGALVADGEHITMVGAIADPLDPMTRRGQLQGATPGLNDEGPALDLSGEPEAGHVFLQRAGDARQMVALLQGTGPEADGEVSLILANAAGARRAVVPGGEGAPAVMGVIAEGERLDLVVWADDTLSLMATEAEAGPESPAYERPDDACPQATVAPEDCTDQDRDCDGDPRNGICCADEAPFLEGRFPGRLRVGRFDLPTPTGLSPDGQTMYFAIDVVPNPVQLRVNDVLMGQVALDGTEVAGAVATYSLMHDPQMFRTTEGAVVFTAIREELELPALAWYVEQEDGSWEASDADAPCEPVLEMEFLDDGRLRVYCPDAMFQIPAGGGGFAQGELVRYPGNVRGVQWVRRHSFPGPVEGGSEELLVAVGDEYELAHWRSDLSGEPLLAVDELPHPELDLLIDRFERDVPIYGPTEAGGYMVRRTLRKWLEVFIPGYGWSPVPGSSWPIAAHVTAQLPYAIQSAYLEYPGDTPIPQRPLKFFVHDLRPGGAWWGEPLRFEGDQLLVIDHRGFGLPQFPVSAEDGLPRMIRLRDGGDGTGYVDGLDVQCGDLP